MITIDQLYEMQKERDELIIRKKGLEGQDLLPNTVLALQVELGELANEWRGFKHWSNDREPRTKVKCKKCNGRGYDYKCYVGNGWARVSSEKVECDCLDGYRNLLLEEYVDCLHFFLSIAHQKNWQKSIYFSEEAIWDVQENGFDGGITGAFVEMQYWLLRSYMENKPIEIVEKKLGYETKEFHFRNAFFIFVALGLVGFGFTWEEIAAAYVAKNRINYERQENGY